MTQDVFKGAWKELKGNVKRQWGKPTDDDLMQIDGNRDVLVRKLQERYGYSKAQAEADYNRWLATQDIDRRTY